MLLQGLGSVFANAALPQKIVLLLLAAAVPLVVVATGLALRRGVHGDLWRRVVADLRVAGPVVGLFVGGLNGFHMGETIQRLPFDPTLKQLAPGIFEISTLVSLGGLVGVVAMAALATIELLSPRRPSAPEPA